MNGSGEAHHRCALCGFELGEGDARTGCRGCPMAGACHMIKCPNCGYEVPVAPEMKRVKDWWRRVFGGKAMRL